MARRMRTTWLGPALILANGAHADSLGLQEAIPVAAMHADVQVWRPVMAPPSKQGR